MDASIEITVTAEHRDDNEIVLADGVGDRLRQGTAVADARRAAVTDQVKPQRLEGGHQAGSFQVGCDHGGAGSQTGLHRGVAPQSPLHGLLGQQPRGHHHLGVAGVGATRDRRNRHRAMAQLHAIPVQLHVDHFRSRGPRCGPRGRAGSDLLISFRRSVALCLWPTRDEI